MGWYDDFSLPADIGNTDWISRTGPHTSPGMAYATAIGGGVLKGLATGLQARHLREDEDRKQAAEDLKTALDAGDEKGAIEAGKRLHGDSFTPEMAASLRRQAQMTANDSALKRAVTLQQAKDAGVQTWPGGAPPSPDFLSMTPTQREDFLRRKELGDQFDALQKTAGLPVGSALTEAPPSPGTVPAAGPPTSGPKGVNLFPMLPRVVDPVKSAQQRDGLLGALGTNPDLPQQLLGGGLQQMVNDRVISLKDAQIVADKARAPIEEARKRLKYPLSAQDQAMIGAQEIPGAPGYYLSESGGSDHDEALSELESATKTYGTDLPPDYRDWSTTRLLDRVKFLHQTHPTGLAVRAPNDQKEALLALYRGMPAEIQLKYKGLVDQAAPSSDMDEATLHDYKGDLQTAYREFLQDHHFQTTLDYRKWHDAVRDRITQALLGYRGQALGLELNKFNAELPLLDLRTKEALQRLQSHPERWDQSDQNKLQELEGQRRTAAANYQPTEAIDAQITQVYEDAAKHIAARKTGTTPVPKETAHPATGKKAPPGGHPAHARKIHRPNPDGTKAGGVDLHDLHRIGSDGAGQGD